MIRRIPLLLLFAAFGLPLAGCGDDRKRPSSADRAAMDRFAEGTRKWRIEGTEPWNSAFKRGTPALIAEGPALEAKMESAIRLISSGANGVTEPTIRRSLQRLAATYRGKLAAIRQIDRAGYSMAAIQAGLSELAKQGTATKRAWEAYVAQARKTWNANPLAGLDLG